MTRVSCTTLAMALVLGTLSSVMHCSGGEHDGNQRPESSPPIAIGRFSTIQFQDNLVMLDTASGNTWILNRDKDQDRLSWIPILRHQPPAESTDKAAKSATGGRVDIEIIRDGRAIILRGSKDDVGTAAKVMREVEQGTGSKIEFKQSAGPFPEGVEAGMQADRIERESRLMAPIKDKVKELDSILEPRRNP